MTKSWKIYKYDNIIVIVVFFYGYFARVMVVDADSILIECIFYEINYISTIINRFTSKSW